MAFVRIKTIKGRKYAYLVENSWTKAGSRQKSKKYLGRIYVPVREQLDSHSSITLHGKSKSELLNSFVGAELLRHGFVQKNSRVLQDNDCIVDLKAGKVMNHRGKNVALAMNDGVLCGHTFEGLHSEKPSESDSKEGLALAKAVVEAGLDIPKNSFIALAQL